MGRRAVRALLLLTGAMLALTGCLPSVPFRLPTLYEGSAFGTMTKLSEPDLCPGVHVVMNLAPSFFIEDQPSGRSLGHADGQIEITYCQPDADDSDVDVMGRMRFICCNSPEGVPGTTEFSGPAHVRRSGRDLTVDLDIETGTGRYEGATGVCNVNGFVYSVTGDPDPPPPTNLQVLGGFTCRIGGPAERPPPPSFRLTTSDVPDPVRSQPYRAELVATGGTPPYTWTATGLPAGLRVDGDAIVGTPTTPGESVVEVVVRDAAGLTRSVTLTLFTQDPDVVGTVQPISDDPLSLWQGGPVSISADASMVAFVSPSAELVDPPDPFAGQDDVFALDRSTDTVRRITDNGPYFYNDVQVSGDGGTVVFSSDAPLVVEDTNGTNDVYAADTAGGWITRVSSGAVQAFGATVSNDGRTVAFTEGDADVDRLLVWDRPTGAISVVADGNGGSWDLDLSDDTSRLTFISSASDLVPGDDNGVQDLFLADLASGAVTRLGTGEGNLDRASISGDGGTVAFSSDTTAFLSPGEADTNGGGDVFLLDLATGGITRLTNGDAPSGGNARPAISDARQVVAFSSLATDIASGERDRREAGDVFLWNGETGLISRITRGPHGGGVFDISGDGRLIALGSLDPDLSPATPVEPVTTSFLYLWTRTG